MKKRVAGKEWIPLWIDQWIFGSTRIELNPEERGIFIDLLALAGKDDGYIRANEDIGYLPIQLAGILNVDLEILKKGIKKCIETDKIIEVKPNIYKIKNWEVYQLSDRTKREYKMEVTSEKMEDTSEKVEDASEKMEVASEKAETNINNNININNNSNSNNIRKDKKKDIVRTKKTNPNIKEFIDWYSNEYQSRLKTKYIITSGAKDGRLIKKLLSVLTIEKLKELAIKFFESKDAFITQSGYTIGAFFSQINKLQLGKVQKIKQQEEIIYPSL